MDAHAHLRELGSRLREVRRDLLRQQPGLTQRWFQGPRGCDLFLWYDERRGLCQLQVTLERRAVDWSLDTGLRTARLHSFDPRRPERDAARLVYDAVPDPETLALADALLSRAAVDDLTLALVRKQLQL